MLYFLVTNWNDNDTFCVAYQYNVLVSLHIAHIHYNEYLIDGNKSNVLLGNFTTMLITDDQLFYI